MSRGKPPTPAEQRFRFGDWVAANLAIVSQSGPEWLCVCPACGREKLAVNIARRAFHCLSAACGIASYRPSVLVAITRNIGIEAALEEVAGFGLGRALGPVGPLEAPVTARKAADLPPASLPPVYWGLELAQAAYAAHRGIPEEHARLFGLATVLSDHTGSMADHMLAGRLLFPVWGPTGRIVFWAARAIHQSKAKVINMPRACRSPDHDAWCTCEHARWGLPLVARAANAGEVVLGLHLVQPGRPVMVVEGPIDAAVCGPGVVSSLGAHVTPMQAALIASRSPSEVIVLFDGDEGGRAGLPGAVSALSALLPTRGTLCPAGTDPAVLGRAHAWAHAMSAQGPGGLLPLRPVVDRSAIPAVPSPFIRSL